MDGLPSNMAVLAVENDVSAQQLFRWMLPDTYALDTVRSAAAAQKAIRRAPYDVVLMDIDLDGPDSGLDVLQAMPKEVIDTTQVLAVTAYAMPGDRERFMEAGFDGYLAKPFTQDQFTQALQALFAD